MPRKAKAVTPPPCGVRTLPSGRITLQIRTSVKGVKGRYSQHTIDSREPESYADMAEARAGYDRVMVYLAEQVDRDQTVRGFWERWLDPDDARWGLAAMPDRSEHARYIYASRTRAFIGLYGDRAMAEICEADIRAYQQAPVFRRSHMKIITTFLRDAEADGLRKGNPAKQITKEAVAALNRHRERNKPKAPSLEQVEAALAHMRRHLDRYPRSFYGWFLTGVRTGMRGAEIDAMQFEYVETPLYFVRWQLHAVTKKLALPKWVRSEADCRHVFLPDDVQAEIRHQRKERMGIDGWDRDYIWLNTEFNPWHHNPREKWWHKQIGGTSLRAICGDVPIYNATRHHWATYMLTVAHANPVTTSQAFGHKDGGALMLERYVSKDRRAAALAAGQAQTAALAAQAPVVNLEARR